MGVDALVIKPLKNWSSVMQNILRADLMSPFIYAAAGVLLMWSLYIVGVQYKRGGLWGAVLPITVAALLLDVAFNYTLFALLTLDWPRPHEYTFSTRLERLIHLDDWRGALARGVAEFMLDPFDPTGKHIR